METFQKFFALGFQGEKPCNARLFPQGVPKQTQSRLEMHALSDGASPVRLRASAAASYP